VDGQSAKGQWQELVLPEQYFELEAVPPEERKRPVNTVWRGALSLTDP
jgi:hypothetical protein